MTDDVPAAPEEPAATAGGPPADLPEPSDETGPTAEALVAQVTPPRVVRDVDPEDWAGAGGSDDDRYLRDRPPHWG